MTTENHHFINKGTNTEVPGKWLLPYFGTENVMKQYDNITVLWMPDNEDGNDIGLGLNVSAIGKSKL